MTHTISIVIACVALIIISAIAYQYIVNRVDGKTQIRNLVKLKFDFIPLVVILISFFVSMLVFVYGLMYKNDGFARSALNSLVALWLGILAYIDTREKIIPNGLVGIALAVVAIFMLLQIFVGHTPWLKLMVFCLLGGIGCGGLLMVISLISKSSLGMGDVKMFFVLGLIYGLMDTYGILLFSIIVMSVVSIILLILKKVTTKTKIPMAPFVAIGFILSIVAGI